MSRTPKKGRMDRNNDPEQGKRKLLRRGDLFIVLLVLVAALALGAVEIHRSRQPVPVVYAKILQFDEGRQESFYPLYEGQDTIMDFYGPVGVTRVRLHDGQAAIICSDCPDDVCVTVFGWIGFPGQVSVCLPNRIMVEILSVDDVERP